MLSISTSPTTPNPRVHNNNGNGFFEGESGDDLAMHYLHQVRLTLA